MRELEMALAGCVEAHLGLLASFDGLTDEVAAGPSLLPDWSVGHVLTHIARSA
jgi:maleylpyruvate isomerase